MGFAILRTAKLKTIGSIAGSLSHTYRTRETTNADPDQKEENEHSQGTPAEVLAKLKDRLPEKHRKDAVLALEFFVGASPEWFKDHDRGTQDAYFKDAVNWLEKRHGAANVVGWSVHRDETSPHLVAYVVPLDGDKLNAKKWTGGKAALSKMQSDFAQDVAAKYGLQRGIEGSKAHHQTIKEFYGLIDKPGQHVTISPEAAMPKVIKKGFLSTEYETPEMVAERLTKAVQRAYSPAIEGAKLAAAERRRADEMAATARSKDEELKTLQARLQAMEKHLAPVLELARLAKNEFVQLVIHAQERVAALKQASIEAGKRKEIDQEQQRRVDDLVRVEKKTAGTSCTLASHALEAIRLAGGDARRVDWAQVERAAVMESIVEHQQPPKDALAAVLKYSPGMADPARHERAQQLVSRIAGAEIKAPTKGREGPSMGH
jgi:hypothetical protein